MIASSPVMKALSLAAAAAAIVGAASVTSPRQSVELAGSGEAIEARMGTSFADMSIGTLTSVPTQSVTAAPPPTPIKAEEVRSTATPQAVTATAAPVPLAKASPITLSTTAPAPKTIVATQDAAAAPQISTRPAQRDPVLAAKAAPPKPLKKAAPEKAPRGNADRTNSKGASNGTKAARATTKGTAQQASAQSGTAAASNYPGAVMRRIARVSKPRVSSRGTATVAFSVSSDGGLAAVSIARSSGSAALDQAAVGVIRKAAPFPAPPRGAQRNFSIRIKGR